MTAPELPDVVLWAVPAFVGLMLLELLLGHITGRARYELRDTVTSLSMGVGNLVVGATVGLISGVVLTAAYELTPLRLGWSPLALVACFVLDDLRYYWWHRLAHEVRWFWMSHVNHHSSQHYNLSTALRQDYTFYFTGAFVFQVPLALMGFHPLVIAFSIGVNLIYQFWIHTELIDRFPRPIEYLFNTPSHHRVHHATNARYLDANYAGTLMIWDRMFGSFVPEQAHDPPRYGLVKNLGTFNPLRVAFHEWVGVFTDATRPGLSLRQRLGYMFGPPGWSHDGSRDTTVTLKANHVKRFPQHAGEPGLPPRAEASEA